METRPKEPVIFYSVMFSISPLRHYIPHIKKALSASWLFLTASIVANIINMLFNIYLGRTLETADYGLIAFLVSILYVASIVFSALANTVNHVLSGGQELSQKNLRRIFLVVFFFSAAWIVFSPIAAHRFQINGALPLILFAPALTLGVFVAMKKGILQSELRFKILGIAFLGETVVKLTAAVAFVQFGFSEWVYLSLPLAVLTTYLIVKRAASSCVKKTATEESFPFPFFASSMLAGISTIAFLSADIILVKLFFPPDIAGQYALLALTGKMLYFLGSILSSFIIPLVSRDENKNLETRPFIKLLFTGTILLTLGGALFFILFGKQFFSLLFGEKFTPVLPLLAPYVLAMSAFTISSSLALYHLAKKRYLFPALAIMFSSTLVLGIVFMHDSLRDVVRVFLTVSLAELALFIFLSFFLPARTRMLASKDMKANANTAPKTRPTVTIALPAYNEGANIGNLLAQLLQQNTENFILEKILVLSDGSTDNTVVVAKTFEKSGVQVIDGKENLGKSFRQNQAMEISSSDILVMMDADLLIGNNTMLANLIRPIVEDGADLTSQWPQLTRPQTWIERVLQAGFELKYRVYTHFKNGSNIYTCVGAARAFSKRLYKDIQFPAVSSGEDQYSYLYCVRHNFKYQQAKDAVTFFKLPSTFKDYRSYALRIFQTQRRHGDVFGEEFVKKEHCLPFYLVLESSVVTFIKRPIDTATYIALHLYMQHQAMRQPISVKATYETLASTKKLT